MTRSADDDNPFAVNPPGGSGARGPGAWRTPLVYYFRQFNDELFRIEHAVDLGVWLVQHGDRIHVALEKADKDLAREFLTHWEGTRPGSMAFNRLEISAVYALGLCRAVDDFNTLIATFLAEVFRVKRDALVETESDTNESPGSTSAEDRRQKAAARKIRQLSRFRELIKFLGKQGLAVEMDHKVDERITTSSATRNVIAHNADRVDEEFRRVTGRTDLAVGEAIQVDHETFIETLRALRLGADAFQVTLGGKFFGWSGSAIPTWQKD